MSWKLWSVFLGGAIGILGVPYLLAYHMRLGEFAKSPQTVEIPLGGSALVAGGRARLWFEGEESGSAVQIACKKEERFFESSTEPTETTCGIQARFLDSSEREVGCERYVRGRFEVTWGE